MKRVASTDVRLVTTFVSLLKKLQRLKAILESYTTIFSSIFFDSPRFYGTFSSIRPKVCGNYAFPQNFHTRNLGETTVFFALLDVGQGLEYVSASKYKKRMTGSS